MTTKISLGALHLSNNNTADKASALAEILCGLRPGTVIIFESENEQDTLNDDQSSSLSEELAVEEFENNELDELVSNKSNTNINNNFPEFISTLVDEEEPEEPSIEEREESIEEEPEESTEDEKHDSTADESEDNIVEESDQSDCYDNSNESIKEDLSEDSEDFEDLCLDNFKDIDIKLLDLLWQQGQDMLLKVNQYLDKVWDENLNQLELWQRQMLKDVIDGRIVHEGISRGCNYGAFKSVDFEAVKDGDTGEIENLVFNLSNECYGIFVYDIWEKEDSFIEELVDETFKRLTEQLNEDSSDKEDSRNLSQVEKLLIHLIKRGMIDEAKESMNENILYLISEDFADRHSYLDLETQNDVYARKIVEEYIRDNAESLEEEDEELDEDDEVAKDQIQCSDCHEDKVEEKGLIDFYGDAYFWEIVDELVQLIEEFGDDMCDMACAYYNEAWKKRVGQLDSEFLKRLEDVENHFANLKPSRFRKSEDDYDNFDGIDFKAVNEGDPFAIQALIKVLSEDSQLIIFEEVCGKYLDYIKALAGERVNLIKEQLHNESTSEDNSHVFSPLDNMLAQLIQEGKTAMAKVALEEAISNVSNNRDDEFDDDEFLNAEFYKHARNAVKEYLSKNGVNLDDEDETFDDEQLIERLEKKWPGVFSSKVNPILQRREPIMNSREHIDQFRDPQTGKIVTEVHSFKRFIEDVRSLPEQNQSESEKNSSNSKQ